MKRLTALLLCMVIFFGFSGCKEKEGTQKSDTVDISYYISHGEIPEADYKIGDTYGEIKEEFEKKANEESAEDEYQEFFYSEFEKCGMTVLSDGVKYYFFKKPEEKEEVKAVAAFDGAYGFAVGDLSAQIAEALDEEKIEYTERILEPEEIEYIPGAANFSGIIIQDEKYTLTFAFDRSQLVSAKIEIKE